MKYDLKIGVKNKNIKDYRVNFKDRNYLITSNLNNCDCIASNRLVKLALNKNKLLLHNILFDIKKSSFIQKLFYYHLQCFCVDTQLDFEKYKDKSKAFPIDLNDFDKIC